ncbi:hypothetical protein AYI70_g2310 [Smittium culicis]|uniref:Uncharacterized protein n=1 Tax=Smittium culicis TaxID=133412 RepID=A0A1R1Y933_9FUNG|nr:hypothetical protein AYI70_g2310 [Smittium culicis]
MKKTDPTFYRIQFALAQATRPIEYYFHRRMQENKGIDTSEDPAILFSNTIRALLSEIAVTVTQARRQQSMIPKDTGSSYTVKVPRIAAANTAEASQKIRKSHSNLAIEVESA